MTFRLHPRLEHGGHALGKLGVCRVLLKDNALFPWFILVPETDNDIIEFHHLSETDGNEVMRAVRTVSHFIEDHYRPDKINIGMLGNQVPQLHVHVIGRFESDPAWPGDAWSCKEKQPYSAARVAQVRRMIRPWIGGGEECGVQDQLTGPEIQDARPSYPAPIARESACGSGVGNSLFKLP